MIFQNKQTVLREKCEIVVEDDEDMILYEAPEELEAGVHLVGSSRTNISESGRYSEAEIELYLELYQEVLLGDKVTIGSDVYEAISDPIEYLRHKVVMLKWLSKTSD